MTGRLDSEVIIIVGGGATGAGIAPRLRPARITNALLIERRDIATGATGPESWTAAQRRPLRGDRQRIRPRMHQ